MPIKIENNYDLRAHNTFGLSVKAKHFVTYDTVDELTHVLASTRGNAERILHIGAGSNLLLTKDFDGTILHSGIKFIECVSRTDKEIIIRAGAGVEWDHFCAMMAQRNYYGSENLSHIPGEVGAAAVQNIGAYGVEVESIIRQVETIEIATGKPRVMNVEQCRYGYRDSIFKNELQGQLIVTAVVFALSTVPKADLHYGQLQALQSAKEVPSAQTIRDAVIAIRKSKLPDPSELGSAGSFFKNPVVSIEFFNALALSYKQIPHYATGDNKVKIPAAWLIEQCGLKGKTHGGAAVYEKQPLVIVNTGRATPTDIIELAHTIQQSVYEKFKIKIQPEVNYI